MQKIDQCNIIFDFNDASADMKSKEIKRLALHELLDYVANNRQVITEPMYPRVVEMFSKNLFRPLPPPVNPQGDAFDPEEDESFPDEWSEELLSASKKLHEQITDLIIELGT